jgi:hypothetical protein
VGLSIADTLGRLQLIVPTICICLADRISDTFESSNDVVCGFTSWILSSEAKIVADVSDSIRTEGLFSVEVICE